MQIYGLFIKPTGLFPDDEYPKLDIEGINCKTKQFSMLADFLPFLMNCCYPLNDSLSILVR
jgi:hypothetical protein